MKLSADLKTEENGEIKCTINNKKTKFLRTN